MLWRHCHHVTQNRVTRPDQTPGEGTTAGRECIIVPLCAPASAAPSPPPPPPPPPPAPPQPPSRILSSCPGLSCGGCPWGIFSPPASYMFFWDGPHLLPLAFSCLWPRPFSGTPGLDSLRPSQGHYRGRFPSNLLLFGYKKPQSAQTRQQTQPGRSGEASRRSRCRSGARWARRLESILRVE